MRDGVIVRTVINGMVFDGATTDPIQQAVRDALIAFMAATAEAQAIATPRGRASPPPGRQIRRLIDAGNRATIARCSRR
jgi:hypothetical protein